MHLNKIHIKMYFEKYLLIFLTVIFVHYTCYCESGVNEIYKNNVIEKSFESLLFTNGETPIISLNDNADRSDDSDECKCKNGRCETTCAEWSGGACLRMKNVCVCDPEFGKFDDQKCLYCNCGKGFNCTIDRNSRGNLQKCICPEGYYDYYEECAEFCSDSKPCLNGGTCQNGRCKCHSKVAAVHGPFCERIFWCAYECRPRLTVDCVYNQEKDTYGCQCKNRSLVFDYKEQRCKPCPCGEGTCWEERHELRCDCKPGYKEFDRQCKKCDCGPDHDCELHYRTGEKICKCRQGYFVREGTCLPCECGHKEATCSLDNVSRKICNCPEGYVDNLGVCEETKANCTCHPTAKCIKKDKGFTCACEDGYMGKDGFPPAPGEPCIDIDECDMNLFMENLKHCPKWQNQKCINFPGSFMCQCETGYQPVGDADESSKITCKEYKVSWLPTGITIGVVIVFIAATMGLNTYLIRRQSSRSATTLEMRRSR